MHVLETFPRDELFQASVPELVRIVRGIVNLYERRACACSCAATRSSASSPACCYVPRDRYNTQARERIERILLEELGGHRARVAGADLRIGARAPAHARAHDAGAYRAAADVERIERRITAALRTWADQLREELSATRARPSGAMRSLDALRRRLPGRLPGRRAAGDAIDDIEELAALARGPDGARHAAATAATRPAAHCTCACTAAAIPSRCPTCCRCSRTSTCASSTSARTASACAMPARRCWIQDLEVTPRRRPQLDPQLDGPRFEAGFLRRLDGRGRERWLQPPRARRGSRLATGRGAARGLPLPAADRPAVQPALHGGGARAQRGARRAARLDCSRRASIPHLTAATRTSQAQGARRETRATRSTTSRAPTTTASCARSAAVILATLRTNYYQRDADGEPQALPLVQARPAAAARAAEAAADVRDLRVLAARRGRAPAHGHGRARRAALVGPPRGLPHRDPRAHEGAERQEHGDRAGRRQGRLRAEAAAGAAAATRCSAKASSAIAVHPRPARRDRQRASATRSCRRRAPCATTATIRTSSSPPTRARPRSPTSPMRSPPSTASGSATPSPPAARPATTTRRWASRRAAAGSASSATSASSASTRSRRTSRVAGIGDMAGDVFGNGMLLSPHIRLVAAFNHQHIFLDPDPGRGAQLPRARAAVRPAALDLGATTTARLISKGGGVYARNAKDITLSPQARALLGIEAATATPDEVIRAILKLPVDLLWNGGIGTYVKASREANAAVGDRANDAVRVNGRELRCQRRRRRRQPRPLAARAHRVRAARRPHQHRFRRQLRRRRLLGPRGQHQDPAQRRAARTRRLTPRSATSCSRR